MSIFFSERYMQLEPYTPGEQPQDRRYIKLNTNESPFPPSPGVLRAVEEEAKRLQLYSDPESRNITSALAEHYGLKEDQILVGNGSDELLKIALGAFNVIGTIHVTDEGKPVPMLNELEVVGNTLYANIWQTALIAVIELPSGKVVKYLDFSAKAKDVKKRYPSADVLNGIAYDGKSLWVTGKNWPQIYKIKF